MKNLWKTVLALGFAAGMGIAGLSAQTTEGEPATAFAYQTINPREVPLPSPQNLLRVTLTEEAGYNYANFLFDTDGDGNKDEAYICLYEIVGKGLMSLTFLAYSRDSNGDDWFHENETRTIDYSNAPESLEILNYDESWAEILDQNQIPLMYFLKITRLAYSLGEESEEAISLLFDHDGNKYEDARFVFTCEIDRSSFVVKSFDSYMLDVDNNGMYEFEDEVKIRASAQNPRENQQPQGLPEILEFPETQEAPQLPDFYDLWNDFFDLEEESGVGV
jgi:hypothetical protein